MRFHQKLWVIFMLILFIIIEEVILVGCSNHEQNAIFFNDKIPKIEMDKEEIMQDGGMSNEEIKEDMRLFGQKTKELSAIPGIDDPVILVNGQAIMKRSIEIEKITPRHFQNSDFLKRGIILMVRKKVVEQEALSKGIQPSQDEIDSYLEGQKELNKTYGAISGYAEGMGITEEEYLAVLKENAYGIFQRAALQKSFEASQKDKIEAEAIEREVKPSVVEKEYWERYVDGLIKKAKIEILDPEIKKLFGIEVK